MSVRVRVDYNRRVNRGWHFVLFATVVVYLTLFYNLGRMAFIGADEPRYARVAEEMTLSGDYVTPRLNHRPWLEKPPLLYWIEALSFKIFNVSEWSARFPVALSACACLLFAGFFVSRGWSPGASFASVLVLATTPLFFVYGRAGSTDMPLAAALTGSLVFGHESIRVRSSSWALASGICLGLAALAKGPVALLLFGGTFGLYFLVTQRFGWSWSGVAAGLAGCLLVSVPWYWEVSVANGYDFVATFWLNHHLARFLTDIHHHSQPFWYYLPVMLVGFFPWLFFLGTAVMRLWQNRAEISEYGGEVFLWLWAVVPLVFFSASQSKLPGYILPSIPALAMLVGIEIERQLVPDLRTYRFGKIQVALMAAFGLILSIVILIGFHVVYGSLALGIILALPIALGMVGAQYYISRTQLAPLFFAIVASMTLFAALAFWRAAPVIDDYHSARDLSAIAVHRISGKQPLILYRYFHHTALYYTDYQALAEPINKPGELNEYFQKKPQGAYLLLTQKPGWLELAATFPSAKLVSQRGNLYLVEVSR